MENDMSSSVILAARLLLATLFLIFGWRKLMDYSGTVKRMVQDGAPLPVLSAAVAIFMELPVALAVAVGAFTRPSAALLAFYTLGASLIAPLVGWQAVVDDLAGRARDLFARAQIGEQWCRVDVIEIGSVNGVTVFGPLKNG